MNRLKCILSLGLLSLFAYSCANPSPIITDIQQEISEQLNHSELPSDKTLINLNLSELTENLVDPEQTVSGSSSVDRTRFNNQTIPKNWKFEQYIYKFTQKEKSYVIQYKTKSAGPVFGVLLSRNISTKKWNPSRYVYDSKNLNSYTEILSKNANIDLILLGFMSAKGGTVDATISENESIPRLQPYSETSSTNSSQSANTKIVNTVQSVAKSDFFKLIKLADPENNWSILNDGVLKEVAKGSVKAIMIGGNLINYVDLYSDIYHGLDEIESQAKYYNANDLTNMKLLLGLEIYMNYFDRGVFAGSALDIGAFRKFYSWYTQTVHQSYNEYLGVEPKSFTLKVQKKSWFFGVPENVSSVRVKMIPARIFEPNGMDSAWTEISLTNYDDRFDYSFSGLTDSKGEIRFTEQEKTKAGIWLVEVNSGGKTHTKYLNIDSRKETIGFNQNMSKTIVLE